MNDINKLTFYIIDFLAGFSVSRTGIVHYGNIKDISSDVKIVIAPAFSKFEITVLPKTPLKKIDDVPILFGDSRVERRNGIMLVYADIIASSFFLLSRYEEILKPDCRDQHGRFCAKDSIVFQQGYGNRPLVDEYGMLFRKWLREVGVSVPGEKKGFSKIYLTHDVDIPFRFERVSHVFRQLIKNMLRYNYYSSPLKKYLNERYDPYYTFPQIINYDKTLQESLSGTSIESIYFFITAGSFLNRKYYNFSSKKTSRLIDFLNVSGAKLGFHVSYEAGENPKKIKSEAKYFRDMVGGGGGASRHHYLQWREPQDVWFMEEAEITDDFSLSYADCVGFRCGTCHPYQFINPTTRRLTNVVIHPLEIMECTLDRYMGLDYDSALNKCKEIISQVYKHNGELVLLWHNTEFVGVNYQERLYEAVLECIKGFV